MNEQEKTIDEIEVNEYEELLNEVKISEYEDLLKEIEESEYKRLLKEVNINEDEKINDEIIINENKDIGEEKAEKGTMSNFEEIVNKFEEEEKSEVNSSDNIKVKTSEANKVKARKPTKVNPADPLTIPKFIELLPIPNIAMPVVSCDDSKQIEMFYNIVMKETYHRFHRLFPLTKVWGYDGTYPGPTIEAFKDLPIRVKWTNKLPYKHFLPLDHTLHGTMDTIDVRTVVHLHGANVAADSDGHPEAWYTRNYRTIGQSFTRKVYEYTNHQPGATLWYHDHAIGITRLNVYAGLAGFYLIRDALERRLNLPSGDYEIPIMIQDKTFNEDGSLFYPNNSTPPVNSPIPSTPSFFFGNTIVVNGKLWPYLNVEPRKYRFRILNASNLRAYGFNLSNGEKFHQIGTDLGLLHHSIAINSFILEPAERIDVIIDFSKYKGKTITLVNGEGRSIGPGDTEDMNSIMKFRVVLPLKSKDESVIPHDLLPDHGINPLLATRERTMHLNSGIDSYGRVMHLLNSKMWSDPVTEMPQKDTIEIWHFVNHFAFPHPMHVHLVHFQILGRKAFTDEDFDEDGNYKYVQETLTPPLDFERGRKDVVRAEAGQVTSVVMHFKEHVGDYVWHCHILEHEDYDMMRPLKIIEKSDD